MTNIFNDVHDFMTRMGKHIPMAPHGAQISAEQLTLAVDLVHEEIFNELENALHEGNMVKIFDGILDGIYVLAFLGHTLGLPLEEGWVEVQRTNMAKLHRLTCPRCIKKSAPDVDCPTCRGQDHYLAPVLNANGKVVKPEGWTPPRLAELIALSLGRYEPQ